MAHSSGIDWGGAADILGAWAVPRDIQSVGHSRDHQHRPRLHDIRAPFATVFTVLRVGHPAHVSLIQPLLPFIAIAASLSRRPLLAVGPMLRAGSSNAVLIYGAGSAGAQLSGAIAQLRDDRRWLFRRQSGVDR